MVLSPSSEIVIQPSLQAEVSVRQQRMRERLLKKLYFPQRRRLPETRLLWRVDSRLSKTITNQDEVLRELEAGRMLLDCIPSPTANWNKSSTK
jgi:hypothetical protein